MDIEMKCGQSMTPKKHYCAAGVEPCCPCFQVTAEACERAESSLAEAVSALKELVRLKDLHDAYERGEINDLTYQRDYGENKPLAWNAARAIIAKHSG